MYPFKTFSLKEMKNIIRNEHKSVGEPILYTLFSKKYSEIIQTLIPSEITPNFITAVGYVSMLISYISTFLFDRNLVGGPRFLPLLNFVTLFIYITTDNVDGVHARKTNQCSPVGKVLDHFIDSNAVFYVVVTLCSSLKFGISPALFWLFLCMMSGFFVAVINEKFTGILNFSIISGASEGLYCAAAIHLCAFVCPSALAIFKFYFVHYPKIIAAFALTYLAYLIVDLFYQVKSKNNQASFYEIFISVSRFALLLFLFVPLYSHKSSLSLLYFLTFSQCFGICCLEEYICMIGDSKSDFLVYLCSYILLSAQFLSILVIKNSRISLIIQFISSLHFIIRSWLVFTEMSSKLGIVLLKMRK